MNEAIKKIVGENPPPTDPPDDIIVDNGDLGTSYTGSWSVSSGVQPYGGNSIYARPEASYTWQFGEHPTGLYEVFMWWTTTGTRGSNVKVDINGSEGTKTVYINQTANAGQWNSIGKFSLEPGSNVVNSIQRQT